MSTIETQRAVVRHLLTTYGRVSARDLLLRHGIARAAARVWELRQEGLEIVTDRGETLPDGTRPMATYRLVVPEPAQSELPW